MKIFFYSFGVFFSFLVSGCATKTISSAPDIDINKVTKPKFEMLKERSLAITLVDNRSEKYRVDSAKWQEKILGALNDIFTRSGIKIDANSKNHFTVTVKDTTIPGQETNDCVETKTKLKSTSYLLEISGSACFSYQSQGGAHLDSDIDRAYEMALSMVFDGIDKKYEEIKNGR